MRVQIILLWCGLLIAGDLLAQDLEAVLDWQRRVELGTLVDGMVSRVNVRPGQRVTRGTLMVELDQRETQARLALAEARRAEAEQQQAEARRELDRSLELYDRTLLSDHERKQAEIDAARADSFFRQADAELTHIRLKREYSRVTAPFDGIVIAVSAYSGQALVNRLRVTPLVTLADPAEMKALVEVDAKTAAGLKTGGAVKVGVHGEWLPGEIAYIGLEPVTAASAKAGGYRLEVSVKAKGDQPMRAGEQVVVRIGE